MFSVPSGRRGMISFHFVRIPIWSTLQSKKMKVVAIVTAEGFWVAKAKKVNPDCIGFKKPTSSFWFPPKKVFRLSCRISFSRTLVQSPSSDIFCFSHLLISYGTCDISSSSQRTCRFQKTSVDNFGSTKSLHRSSLTTYYSQHVWDMKLNPLNRTIFNKKKSINELLRKKERGLWIASTFILKDLWPCLAALE